MARARPFQRVAYLGPAGTFSEEALLSEPDLAAAEAVPAATIVEAIALARAGAVDAALVPIENSIEGAVNVTLDSLIFGADLFIQREVLLDVHLGLLARPGTTLGQITTVLSIPVASAECRDYLAKTLPDASIGATSSTAEAARVVAEEHPAGAAAVAPAIAAKLYGLEVLAHPIEDHPENQTRFVLVAPGEICPPSGHDRTTIVCFQHADRPGSLHEILGQFAARRLNLSKIESRPTKQALGDYCFVIDVEGHIADHVLGDCLVELRAGLEDLRFLGSYPVAGPTGATVREARALEHRAATDWLDTLRARITGPARSAQGHSG